MAPVNISLASGGEAAGSVASTSGALLFQYVTLLSYILGRTAERQQ